MLRRNFPHRREQRRAEAEARQLARSLRGDANQVQRLNREGHRAKRERERIGRKLSG